MSTIFVKLDEMTPSYICTWDSKDKLLQISTNGSIVKKYKGLDLFEALHKIEKFHKRQQSK